MAKKSEAEKIVAEIPEGGYASSPSGGVRVVRGSGDEAGGFRWISGKNEKPLDEDAVLKNLMRVSGEVLSRWTVVAPEAAADDERERAARDEAVRERVGLKRVGAESGSPGNGSRKKPEPEVPEGFALLEGAVLAPGDRVVTDADRGPERVASIGSGGVSRGRAYLKLMLEPASPEGGEARRRFVSPRKAYPIRKATEAARKEAVVTPEPVEA